MAWIGCELRWGGRGKKKNFPFVVIWQSPSRHAHLLIIFWTRLPIRTFFPLLVSRLLTTATTSKQASIPPFAVDPFTVFRLTVQVHITKDIISIERDNDQRIIFVQPCRKKGPDDDHQFKQSSPLHLPPQHSLHNRAYPLHHHQQDPYSNYNNINSKVMVHNNTNSFPQIRIPPRPRQHP